MSDYFDSAKNGFRPFSDFEWYAVDRDGFIAFFTSAGFGPIPIVVFRSESLYFEITRTISDLSCCGGHRINIAGQLYPKPEDWVRMAQRGLFAYDWDSSNAGQYVSCQPYQLIASPARPMNISELPQLIQNSLADIRFNVSFRECRELLVEESFDELNG